MAPSPHLLHVQSAPTHVSRELWIQWYITEHIPDLVNSKTSTRAAFYEETPWAMNTELSHPRPFLAVYETDHPQPFDAPTYSLVRQTSELFATEHAPSDKNRENGDFDARNYVLIQDYDPASRGDKTSPCVLTVEMQPKESEEEDFERWYREEHLGLLARIPGYDRSLRYRIGLDAPLTKTKAPKYLAVHFLEDIFAMGGKEAERANETEWTQKHIRGSKPFVARAWTLVKEEGY